MTVIFGESPLNTKCCTHTVMTATDTMQRRYGINTELIEKILTYYLPC